MWQSDYPCWKFGNNAVRRKLARKTSVVDLESRLHGASTVMIFLTPAWILGFVFAYVYFLMGRQEAQDGTRPNHGPYWALASFLITVAVIQAFGGGALLVVVCQILLFAGITFWRVVSDK